MKRVVHSLWGQQTMKTPIKYWDWKPEVSHISGSVKDKDKT
jgi:hypothetical protein